MELQEYEKKVALVINMFVQKYGYHKTMSYGEIRQMLFDVLGVVHNDFQESNMCYNHINRKSFLCYQKSVILFENVEKGRYRILGEHFPYNGEVIWRTNKGKQIVGVWNYGDLNYWGDMVNSSEEDDIDYSFHYYEIKITADGQETNTSNKSMIQRIDNYLKQNKVVDIKREKNAVIERQRGKQFTFEEHLRGLIYSLLTNQRKWSEIEPKLPQIDKLFFYYNVAEIRKHTGLYFEKGVRNLKCGNISIKKQMEYLHSNIEVFQLIESQYGSLDRFVLSKKPDKIVELLSSYNSKYKLKGVGSALAWEYLRNVGIDGSKSDTHLKRFFGAERIAVSRMQEATDDEVIRAVERLSKESGYTKFEIDYLIWCYCASGKGEVCTKVPQCWKCVIKEFCKYKN